MLATCLFLVNICVLAVTANANYMKGVYRCPIFGGYGGYGPFGSNYFSCGQESIFHYYTCCDYNPNECCMVLEAWVVVLLVIIGIVSLFCCFACCGACYYGVRRASAKE